MTATLEGFAPEEIISGGHVAPDRREQARAALGVAGGQDGAVPLRPVLKANNLSLYPTISLGLLGFVDVFQGDALTVVTPEVSTALGVGLGAIGAARALQFLAQAMAPMPMAALSQKRGKRVVLCIVTALAWSLITLFTGFVTSLVALIFILIADGLSTGSVTALHAPLLADSYPTSVRVRIQSSYVAVATLGHIAAPLLVALLSGPFHLTWRGDFLGMGLLSTLISLTAIGLKDPGPGRFDTERLHHAVADEDGHPFAVESTIVISDGTTDLGFFEILRRLLLIPTIQRLMVGFLVFGMLLIPFLTFLSSFLSIRWNLTPSGRGLVIGTGYLIAVVGLVIYGKVAENDFAKDPGRVVRRVGNAVIACVIFVALGGVSTFFIPMVILMGLGLLCIGITGPGLNSVVLSIVDARQRSHVAALAGLFLALGALLGVALLAGVANEYGITGSIISLLIPGLPAGFIIRSAAKLVSGDIDRMVDGIIEEEDLTAFKAAGGRPPMLTAKSVNFSYGQLQVLFDVDFTVDEGEMVALLGTNGAGKSTLLKVISGIGLPQSGTVRFRGDDITYLDAERRVKLGVTQIPGGRAVFGRLTVIENLRGFGYTLGADKRRVDESIEMCLEAFPRLDERKTSLGATLSGGEQQMLGLCKALILKPKLLLIDELSLGLAPVIVGQLLEMVRRINAEGTAVVLVEQSVNIALSLVNHAYFMEKGQMRFDGPAQDLLGRDDLLRAVFLEGATKGQKVATK